MESKIIWAEFLNHVEEKFLGYTPIISRDSEYTAVIIEPREHNDLLLSIRSTMYYLNETDSKIKWGLQIFHGNKNENLIRRMTKGWSII